MPPAGAAAATLRAMTPLFFSLLSHVTGCLRHFRHFFRPPRFSPHAFAYYVARAAAAATALSPRRDIGALRCRCRYAITLPPMLLLRHAAYLTSHAAVPLRH